MHNWYLSEGTLDQNSRTIYLSFRCSKCSSKFGFTINNSVLLDMINGFEDSDKISKILSNKDIGVRHVYITNRWSGDLEPLTNSQPINRIAIVLYDYKNDKYVAILRNIHLFYFTMKKRSFRRYKKF